MLWFGYLERIKESLWPSKCPNFEVGGSWARSRPKTTWSEEIRKSGISAMWYLKRTVLGNYSWHPFNPHLMEKDVKLNMMIIHLWALHTSSMSTAITNSIVFALSKYQLFKNWYLLFNRYAQVIYCPFFILGFFTRNDYLFNFTIPEFWTRLLCISKTVLPTSFVIVFNIV